jgi:hypothetical protein
MLLHEFSVVNEFVLQRIMIILFLLLLLCYILRHGEESAHLFDVSRVYTLVCGIVRS